MSEERAAGPRRPVVDAGGDHVNSMDAVIDEYKRHIDATLLDANLRMTIDDRLNQLQRLLEFAEELRRAPRRPATPP